jgi:uncharacterized protein
MKVEIKSNSSNTMELKVRAMIKDIAACVEDAYSFQHAFAQNIKTIKSGNHLIPELSYKCTTSTFAKAFVWHTDVHGNMDRLVAEITVK